MNSKYIFLLVVAALLTGCTGKQAEQAEQQASGIITSQDALSFPLGQATENLALFNGTVYLLNLVNTEEVFNSPGMAHVVFPPGIINKWHIHTNGQILIATDGTKLGFVFGLKCATIQLRQTEVSIGYHQIEGQPIEVMYLRFRAAG
jgi:hypothetical protein